MSGDVAALGPRTNRQASVCVRLIEGFELCVDGHAVEAPSAAQRLVAFLALHPRPLTRSYIAGSLWLDKTDSRATSNLRSSLRYGGRMASGNDSSGRIGRTCNSLSTCMWTSLR